MTTLFEPPTHRAWRVNRVTSELADLARECGDPRLSRKDSLRLAVRLRQIADTVADLYVCPVCRHPDACTCSECPVGSITAP